MNIRDFDEYEPPAPGTRFDVGTTAIEYVDEYNLDYFYPTEELEAEFRLRNSATYEELELVLGDFDRFPSIPGFHGIWHGTINSGYLVRITNDGEGAFLFRHWGK